MNKTLWDELSIENLTRWLVFDKGEVKKSFIEMNGPHSKTPLQRFCSSDVDVEHYTNLVWALVRCLSFHSSLTTALPLNPATFSLGDLGNQLNVWKMTRSLSPTCNCHSLLFPRTSGTAHWFPHCLILSSHVFLDFFFFCEQGGKHGKNEWCGRAVGGAETPVVMLWVSDAWVRVFNTCTDPTCYENQQKICLSTTLNRPDPQTATLCIIIGLSAAELSMVLILLLGATRGPSRVLYLFPPTVVARFRLNK